MTSNRTIRIVALVAAAITVATGCGATTNGSGQTTPSDTATAAPFPTDTLPDESASESESPATEAPEAIGTGKWTYTDGLSVQVSSVRRFTFGEYDSPSNKPGVAVAIKITNGSHAVVDTALTMVDMTYGAEGAQAESGYGEVTHEIESKVTPGRTVTGVYTFAVPRGTQPVTVQVTPTFDYSAALFEGTIK